MFCAMYIVAGETGDAVRVHETGNIVVALHPVLVGGAIGEMCKRSLAEFVLFQFPKLVQRAVQLVTHRPVVVFPSDGIRQGATLGMTLNANVIGRHVG